MCEKDHFKFLVLYTKNWQYKDAQVQLVNVGYGIQLGR